MSVSRSWTAIEDDPRWDVEGYYDSVKAKADGLAAWWSRLETEAEQEGWARQRAFEDGDYEPDDYPRRSWFDKGLTGAREYVRELRLVERQHKDWDDARKAKRAERDAQQEYCLDKLAELGARLMRPYEHWNEDEAYMAWAERERY